MRNPRHEEEKIIKDIANLFRQKRELNYTALKDIGNLFRQEKETKAIKEYLQILRIFLSNKKKKSKPVRVNNFWSNSYIEYEINSDRNTIS